MGTVLQFILANWEVIAAGVYMILEFWLGKTSKTEAGSVIELVLGLLGLGKRLARPK